MPIYYFCIRTPDQISHQAVDRELPDLNAALVEAQRHARALLPKRARRASLRLRAWLHVEDERRRPLARVALADVVEATS